MTFCCGCTTARFPHPVVCFADKGRAYLMREYVPGRTLADWVEAEGPRPERQAADIVRKVCAAVSGLHALTPPVVHRDIKPHNFVVDQADAVRLIDLDTAEEFSPEKPFDTMVMGTALTAAPEQYGYRRCDARTDVFAIGMLFTYLLTGGYDKAALHERHISRALRHLILQCLEFDPDRRPASAKALLDRIDAWKRRWARRTWAALSLAVALAVALTFAISGEGVIRYFESAATLATDPVHTFASPLIERAVRLQLDRPTGNITQRDLTSVTELYLCADTPFKTWAEVDRFGGWQETAQAGDLSDLNSMPNLRMLGLGRLGIRDLTEIGKLPLTRLSLSGNDISDLSPILGIKTLRHLDIAANPVFDLNGLEQCASLDTLNLSATPLHDLSTLTKMHLKKLYMYDMQKELDASALARLDGLETLAVRGLNRGGIDALMQLKSLKEIMLFSCDIQSLSPLRGMPNLTALSLWGSKAPDISVIPSLNLTGLELTGCSLDSIEALRGNATLRWLNISQNPLKDYAVLTTIPGLGQVTCSSDQRQQMDALPDKKFAVQYEDR